MIKRALAWMGVGCVVLGTARARAAAEEAPGFTPVAQQSRVGFEADWLHQTRGGQTANLETFDLTAQIGVTRHLFLDADLSFGVVALGGTGPIVNGELFGNPIVGAHWADRVGRHVGWYAGLGVGIPFNGATPGNLYDEVFSLGMAVRDAGEASRFLGSALPVFVRGGVEVQVAPLFVAVEVSPVIVANLGSHSVTELMESSVVVGLRAPFGLEGGARAQGTFVLNASRDNVIGGLEPFVGYTAPGRVGFFTRYGVLVPFNDSIASGLEGRLITQRLHVGVKF